MIKHILFDLDGKLQATIQFMRRTFSKIKKHGLEKSLRLTYAIFKSKAFGVLSGIVLQRLGKSKTSELTKWRGYRIFVLKILGVDYWSEFSLRELHHHRDLGVEANIYKEIYADLAEGPVSIVSPWNSADIHVYFWFPRRNYELRNVVFDPRSGSVLINGMVVKECSHRVPNVELHEANLAWRCRRPVKLDIGECSGIPWAYNYAHWLAEDLVSVLRIRRQFGDGVPFITPTILNRFQKEALDLLGVKRIEIDRPVRCKEYFLAGQSQKSEAAPRPSDCRLLRQTFLDLASEKIQRQEAFDIYISRLGGSRVLKEELELIQLLSSRGFLIFFEKDYDFADEVALFSRAKSIVGVTGSGLNNMYWMPGGGKVLEIRVNEYYEPSGLYQADLFGLHLSHVDCREYGLLTPANVIFKKIDCCFRDAFSRKVY